MDTIVSKIHRLNMVFTRSATTVIPLDALCDELCDILGCNIYLFDTEGHIFAYSVADVFHCPYTDCSLSAQELPLRYMELFKANDTSIVDRYEGDPKCTYEDVGRCQFNNRYYSIYPVYSVLKKVSGILFIRYEDSFSEAEKILCEYTCAIVSLEMLRQEQEKAHRISKEAAKAKLAVDSLTYSERRAACAALQKIEWCRGEVFLNCIATQTYTAPSTVSGALKKLELATMIETKSRGVKGMHIQVLNSNLRSELEELQRKSHTRSS